MTSPGSDESLQADHAALVGNGHRFSAADGIELGQDGLDVSLGRTFGNGEPPGNVFVAATLGNQLQHIELTLSQAGLCHALQRLRGD